MTIKIAVFLFGVYNEGIFTSILFINTQIERYTQLHYFHLAVSIVPLIRSSEELQVCKPSLIKYVRFNDPRVEGAGKPAIIIKLLAYDHEFKTDQVERLTMPLVTSYINKVEIVLRAQNCDSPENTDFESVVLVHVLSEKILLESRINSQIYSNIKSIVVGNLF